MSIEIQEARKILDILEQIANNPQLILTDLFSKDSNTYSLLYEIDMQGKRYSEYIPEYLQFLDVFSDTIIGVWGDSLHICVSSLKHGDYQDKDRIINIDLSKKTYRFHHETINNYTSIMEKEYKLETYELSDFWKKFENFTIKKRLKGAFSSLVSDKKFHVRLSDFIYLLIVPRKKIDYTLAKVKEENREKNERSLYFYNERIALQNFYKENASAQIEKIRRKQEEIAEYLKSIGYVEDTEIGVI